MAVLGFRFVRTVRRAHSIYTLDTDKAVKPYCLTTGLWISMTTGQPYAPAPATRLGGPGRLAQRHWPRAALRGVPVALYAMAAMWITAGAPERHLTQRQHSTLRVAPARRPTRGYFVKRLCLASVSLADPWGRWALVVLPGR